MKYIIFIFFISFSLSAQIRGVVKDSISGEPIPFVNIWVENETIGTTSETDGSFSLDIKEEKLLVFSALGYEIKKASSKSEVILLKPKVVELKEVVIEQPKFKKEIEIGNFNKPLGFHISGDIEWSNAKFFKYETTYEQTKFVKKIKITTRSKVNNAKFKIRIFSVNKEGSPEDDLLYEDIIVTVKKGKRKNIIDISNLKLVFPEEGLFIAYEVLKIESNKYEFKYTEIESKKLIKKIYYAPDFESN
ncbi:MAG: carboxypeptidase-like regulatory domain-containing protein, partial [Flavobacterium sp.]|nr:carboxypeptidase-like regulatory domain-containing protein [Flavobacterium sp.]